MMLIDKHIDQTIDFFNKIKNDINRVVVFYHGDCDGLISGNLFEFLLDGYYKISDIFCRSIRTEEFDFVEAYEYARNIGPDLCIFLDLSIQDYPEKLKNFSEISSLGIYIYDHHSQRQNSLPENVIYLNPSITNEGFDPKSPPPCYFAAKLCSKLMDRDYSWVATFGLLTEGMYDQCIDLFNYAKSIFPKLGQRVSSPSLSHEYDNGFQFISYTLGSAFHVKRGEEENAAFRLCKSIISSYYIDLFYDNLNQDLKLLTITQRKVSNEINYLFELAKTSPFRPLKGNLLYMEFHTELRVGGVVATRLSYEFPDDIIVTGQYFNNRFVVEARRGRNLSDKVNVLNLLLDSTDQLNPINIGGHPFAAGCSIGIEQRINFYHKLIASFRCMFNVSRQFYSFSWKTNRIETLPNCFQGIKRAICWLIDRQSPQGYWGPRSELGKIIATHQTICTLLSIGFSYDDERVSAGCEWLASPERQHHHKFWRLAALSGVPKYNDLVRDDFEVLASLVEEGKEPNLRHLDCLYLLKKKEILGVENNNEEEIVQTIINLYEGGEVGYKNSPASTSHVFNEIERYQFAKKAELLFSCREYLISHTNNEQQFSNWHNKIIGTSYVLINLCESEDSWKSPQLVNIAKSAFDWILSKQVDNKYWRAEAPLYGGGNDVMSDEYTSAVAIRALIAFMIRNNSNILFALPKLHIALVEHLEQKSREKNKRIIIRILLAILILTGILTYFLSPPIIRKPVLIIATLLGGLISLIEIGKWIINLKKNRRKSQQ